MTLQEAVKLIGTDAMLRVERVLSVPVRIVDVKMAYGAFRFTVQPIGGSGQVTVDGARLLPMPPKTGDA